MLSERDVVCSTPIRYLDFNWFLEQYTGKRTEQQIDRRCHTRERETRGGCVGGGGMSD